MPMADYSEFGISNFAADGAPIMPRDDQSFVEFFKMPRLSLAETAANGGQQVFKAVEMVKVIQPGEKDVTCVMATAHHRARFPRQYKAFIEGQSQQETGTPLEMVFPTSPETIATLKAAHIHSVEQLENLTDTAMQNLPFGRTLVEKAKAYRKATGGAKDFHVMQAEIEGLKAKLAAMEDQKAEGGGDTGGGARGGSAVLPSLSTLPPIQPSQRRVSP
jgi:hypothetical protein